MYLGKGLNFFSIKPASDWGPLYSLWYYILNLFTNDPINLYYLNYKLLIMLLPVALLFFIFSLTKNIVVGFFYSFLLLISMLNLGTWPNVSHFALIIVLVALAIISLIKTNEKKLFIACVAALLVTYIRPEYFTAFLILFFIMIIQFIRKKMKLKYPLIVLFGAATLIIILGNPYSSSRSLTAFGQGYEKYLPQTERYDEKGMLIEWTVILNDNFNDPESVFDAAQSSPGKFINHLWENIRNLPDIIYTFEELIFPSQFIHISKPLLPVVIVSIISVIPFLLFIFTDRTNNKSYFNLFSNAKFLIGISFIYGLPPMIGMILFFSRSHNVLLLLPLFYILLTIVFIPIKIKRTSVEVFVFSFVLLLSFIFLPNLSSWLAGSDMRIRKTIEAIRELPLKEKIYMLENSGGYVHYLRNNFEWVKIYSKDQSFDKFILDNKINMIVDHKTLGPSPQLKNDSTWYSFLRDPQLFGFKEKVLDSGIKIYLKKNLQD